MQYSQNKGYRLPEQAEPYNVDDMNYNSLITDGALKNLEEEIEEVRNITPEEIGAATVVDHLATISMTDWSSNAPYTKTISVVGITSDMTPIIDLIVSDDATTAKSELAAWGMVGRIDTGDGTVTVYCYDEKPGTDMDIRIKVVK